MPGVTTAYQTGVHGSRPANGAGCILYSCTTHNLVYRDNGTTWTTFLTLPTAGSVATDAIWDAAGDLAVGTGADTAAKLSKGADSTVLTIDPSTHLPVWAAPAAGSTPLIGVTAYNPGTVAAVTTSSTSLVDADATNLKVTFTAPASGKVLIRLTGQGSVDTGVTLGDGVFWSLRESTTNLSMPIIVARYVGASSTADIRSMNCAIYLTGVSAGSHTYKWAFCVSGGTTSIRSGGSATGDLAGPSIMEVWSA